MSLEHLQKKLSSHNDSVQKLRSKVNDLKADQLQIQQGIQEKCKLEEQKSALMEESKASEMKHLFECECGPSSKPYAC